MYVILPISACVLLHRALLQKLVVAQLVKKVPTIYLMRSSTLYLQDPATEAYHDVDEFSRHPQTPPL